MVDDIINTDGKVISIRDLNNKFNISNVNIPHYYTMKTKIDLFMLKYRIIGNSTLVRPTYPFHLDVLFKSKSGCRNYYNIFHKTAQNDNPICEII